MKNSISVYRDVALQTAMAAGRLLSRKIGRTTVMYKGAVNLVTEADLQAERLIKTRLLKRFPETDYLGEEGERKSSGSDWLWIVDPLDGTSNYAHGLPIFSVSVGLRRKDKTVLGIVHAPLLKETYIAIKGRGAYLNGKRIHVSKTTSLNASLLATGFPYDRRENPDNNFDNFQRMKLAAQGVRRCGSASIDLCWTACGRYDGYWELRLSPWDVEAGLLILKEAGGRATDFQGGPVPDPPAQVLASNNKIHHEMQDILSRLSSK